VAFKDIEEMMKKLYLKLYRRYLLKESGLDVAKRIGVRVGEGCRFIAASEFTFGSEPYLISIGNHVEIAAEVRFLPHDGAVWVFRESEPEIDLIRPIVVGNNVFIGFRSVILPGTEIGDNCIIGACSVVRGRIPSGSVVAGVPAKVIKMVSEYRKGIDSLLVETKEFSRLEKKDVLLKHFGLK
jgi:acetyltransferase-like isoleucine patch superfamily enzyme